MAGAVCPLVEQLIPLDIRVLGRRKPIPGPGGAPWSTYKIWPSGSGWMTANLTMCHEECTVVQYPDSSWRKTIDLDWTACHFGGKRPWFLCPQCRARVAVLYLGPWNWIRCRRCSGAAYACQRENRPQRMIRKRDRLLAKLGAPPGTTAYPRKPKGMHWATFDRTLAQAQAADDAALRVWRNWALQLARRTRRGHQMPR